MSDTSRRKFLAAAGIGAAGTVGLTATSASASPATSAASTAGRNGDSARQPVVAYIEHHFSDRIHLMVGEREIVVHDRDLVNRILNAAGGR